MAIEKLTTEDIQAYLSGLKDWDYSEGKICRNIQFENFSDAFGFMTQMALFSESASHHPEWSNCYRSVQIQLSTHEVGGVTMRDIEWAKEANKIAVMYV